MSSSNRNPYAFSVCCHEDKHQSIRHHNYSVGLNRFFIHRKNPIASQKKLSLFSFFTFPVACSLYLSTVKSFKTALQTTIYKPIFIFVSIIGISGCFFDPSGIPTNKDTDANINIEDGSTYDSTVIDAYVPDADTSCVDDTFECLPNGHARVCQEREWTDLGACPMGCDKDEGNCLVPSNVPAEIMNEDSAPGIVSLSTDDSPFYFDTDTGEIRGNGTLIRPGAVFGVDPDSGIYFDHYSQDDTTMDLGVFVMSELTIDSGVVVTVEGTKALVLLVDGDVSISGVFNLAARGAEPGAGGFSGGNADNQGYGSCPGLPGNGQAYSDWGCSSGSGGGGHGGLGGFGGSNSDCNTDNTFEGGDCGANCGNMTLIPLVGGSGGAGGATMTGKANSNPGPGGGGCGAIQISSATVISLTSNNETEVGINTGGGGGGETLSGGGSGGGSGGAILLEAPIIELSTNTILAANGGGGGGGDCS